MNKFNFQGALLGAVIALIFVTFIAGVAFIDADAFLNAALCGIALVAEVSAICGLMLK